MVARIDEEKVRTNSIHYLEGILGNSIDPNQLSFYLQHPVPFNYYLTVNNADLFHRIAQVSQVTELFNGAITEGKRRLWGRIKIIDGQSGEQGTEWFIDLSKDKYDEFVGKYSQDYNIRDE